MTKAFEDHVRRQLDIFRHEEAVLSSAVVAKIFEGYDFGGADE